MTLKIGMFRSPLFPWVAFPIEIFFSNPNMLSSMLLMALTLVVKTNNMRLEILLFISNTPKRLWTARLNSFNCSETMQQWTVAGFCGLWPQILRPSWFLSEFPSRLPRCKARAYLTPFPGNWRNHGVRVGAEALLSIRSITASTSTTTTTSATPQAS